MPIIISELLHKTTIDPREAELLLAFVLKKDWPYIIAYAKDKVDSKVAKTFLSLVQRRKKHEPIAYLTGEQPFFGRDFLVNRHTLIPRPETEILVELVKHRTCHMSRVTIIDVGTGSGCLAATLALECPNAKVVASDVSSAALKVAQQNTERLGADVEFVKDDLLGKKLIQTLTHPLPSLKLREGCRRRGELCFVANLPYLPSSDKKTMMPDVAKYEPAKALFAGRDGSSLVVKLLQQISSLCHSEGVRRVEESSLTKISPLRRLRSFGRNDRIAVFLEVDPRQTKKLAALAHQLFPKHNILIKQDLCGRERFLIIV
ncbi:MAG: peptide chain release factor N(5)-glutamine methyltransferase [Patescibacteria group bacterium]|nr:peptide chain release factor N(5)-glutamine methyltransferase [Patescibacteria group bacterium]